MKAATAASGQKIEYDVPKSAGKHGWYCLSVRDGAQTITVSNAFEQDALEQTEGESYRPWNFWYYPDSVVNGPAPHLYDVGQGPYQYQQAFGLDGSPKGAYDTQLPTLVKKRGAPGWHGNCHSMAAASMWFARPQQAVTVNGIVFTEEHCKALLGVYVGTKMDRQPNQKHVLWLVLPTEMPKVGADKIDMYADLIFRCIRDAIYLERQCILVDMENESGDANGATAVQVWNHVMYASRAIFKETEEKFQNDYFNITIEHEYLASQDTYPSTGDEHRTQMSKYRLIFMPDGYIDSGNGKQDYLEVAENGHSMWAPGLGSLLKPFFSQPDGTFRNVHYNRLVDPPPEGLGLKLNPLLKDLHNKIPKEQGR